MIDLITTTRGGTRLSAFRRLLLSLQGQTDRRFRFLVVDQSEREEVKTLCEATQSFAILRIPVEPCGLSKARNQALRYVVNSLVGFPDDDSLYVTDTIERVHEHFARHESWGVVGSVWELNGMPGVGHGRHRVPNGLRVTPVNVFRVATSHSLFFKWEPDLCFDEALGIGTPNGCGEETDVVLESISRGNTIVCDPSIRVRHPGAETAAVPAEKVGTYARGFGACVIKAVRKRGQWLTLIPLASLLLRSLGGSALSRSGSTRIRYWIRFQNTLSGFLRP